MTALSWDPKDEGGHGQCVFEIFWNATKCSHKIIALTRYLSVYGCEINPQIEPR